MYCITVIRYAVNIKKDMCTCSLFSAVPIHMSLLQYVSFVVICLCDGASTRVLYNISVHIICKLQSLLFVWFWFCLTLNVPVNNFSVMSGRSRASWVLPVLFGE